MSTEFWEVQSVLSFLEKGNQDIYKNGHMVRKFLKGICLLNESESPKLHKAIKLALDGFINNLKDSDKALAFLIVCFDSTEQLNSILVDWREVNGISDEQLEEAYNLALTHEKMT